MEVSGCEELMLLVSLILTDAHRQVCFAGQSKANLFRSWC